MDTLEQIDCKVQKSDIANGKGTNSITVLRELVGRLVVATDEELELECYEFAGHIMNYAITDTKIKYYHFDTKQS